jgi:Flp pilus assembly protein TadD
VSTSPFESETTPEEYRQRALLFADLGRYDDAAGEIAAGLATAPADPGLLATLARVHIAAEQPVEALIAAERAVAAAPEEINPLVVRAMALADNRRFADAAGVATEILRRWPDDPFAQRTGAALLSESRNGQPALNAAWQGVKMAETEPEAHLVLAVVAARLRLFDLAQQAYARALDLDEAIGDAQQDVGIVRLERRRWALALESLADEAALGSAAPASPPPPDPSPEPPQSFPRAFPAPDRPEPEPPESFPRGYPGRDRPEPEPPESLPRGYPGRDRPEPEPPESFPRAYPAPDRPEPKPAAFDPTVAARGDVWNGPPPISRPAGPVLDPSADSADALRQAVLYGANGVLVAALLVALMSTASSGASRVWAGLIGVIIFVAVLFWLRRRLTEPMGAALGRLRARDRRRSVAVYLMLGAPLLIVAYAVIGGPIPLVAAMIVAAAAEALVISRR